MSPKPKVQSPKSKAADHFKLRTRSYPVAAHGTPNTEHASSPTLDFPPSAVPLRRPNPPSTSFAQRRLQVVALLLRRTGGRWTLDFRPAFTLIEVMIALGIFFMAVFTILALVSNILRNARGLQRPQIDAGLAAAIYVNTNKFPEGIVSGELGDSLPDYRYEIATHEFSTNGL